MYLELSVSSADGITTVSAKGELDMATQPQFCTALDGLRAAGHDRIVVDFAELAFLDSTGIGTLVSRATAAQERGASLHVVNASGMPLRAMQVTGVWELLDGSTVTGDGGV